MIRYLLFFCFLYGNCFAQTNSSFRTELDNFIKNNTAQATSKNSIAIKKTLYTVESFKQNNYVRVNVDSLYNNATELIKKENIPGLLAWAYAEQGAYHYYLGFYNKALPYFLNSYHLIHKLNRDEIFKPIDVYQHNGYFLGELGLHDKSIAILNKAVKISNPNLKRHRVFLNVIGRYFYRKGNIDSAKVYFNKTLHYSTQNNDYERKAKVLGDFALIAQDEKKYDKAEKLWVESIYLAKKADNKKHVMFAQLHLGKLYIITKQLKKAEEVILKAEKYVISKQHLQFFLHQIKEQQLKIAKLSNNDKDELSVRRYLDSLTLVLENKESATLSKTINWEIAQQRFQQKLKNQQLKLHKEQLIQQISIVVFLLITLLLISFYIASKRKFKLKIAKNEEFISRVKLQKLASEQSLAETKHDLLSYKTYLQEKNKQIEQLEEEIKKVHNERSKESVNHKNELKVLLNSHLMTDENWLKFKTVFINEYQSFYDGFIKENTNITETNLRIVFLHKLQLSNQEISNLLGIGIAGVKKSKQRLRKKIQHFDDFIKTAI